MLNEITSPAMMAKEMAAGQMLRPMTMHEKLTGRKKDLESMLADVNGAIAALEANPEVTKAFEAINKVNRFL